MKVQMENSIFSSKFGFFSEKKKFYDWMFPFYFNFSHFGEILHQKKVA